MNVKEIRSKVTDFFRARKLPAPDKLSDDTAQAIYERWIAGRTAGARSFTRGAQTQLRASTGAESVAAAPVTAPVVSNDDEREQLHRQALLLRIAGLK
ncbi:MAG TPA: hypothetical protein VHA06_00435 [Candidatus Angelobacter sp.]|jgi:hypothetical protein|nr:hypothetical protein [Candidatus Angelobacter sp.]